MGTDDFLDEWLECETEGSVSRCEDMAKSTPGNNSSLPIVIGYHDYRYQGASNEEINPDESSRCVQQDDEETQSNASSRTLRASSPNVLECIPKPAEDSRKIEIMNFSRYPENYPLTFPASPSPDDLGVVPRSDVRDIGLQSDSRNQSTARTRVDGQSRSTGNEERGKTRRSRTMENRTESNKAIPYSPILGLGINVSTPTNINDNYSSARRKTDQDSSRRGYELDNDKINHYYQSKETPTVDRSSTGEKCWDHGCNGLFFPSAIQLARHRIFYLSNPTGTCTICDAKFIFKDDLTDHISAQHEKHKDSSQYPPNPRHRPPSLFHHDESAGTCPTCDHPLCSMAELFEHIFSDDNCQSQSHLLTDPPVASSMLDPNPNPNLNPNPSQAPGCPSAGCTHEFLLLDEHQHHNTWPNATATFEQYQQHFSAHPNTDADTHTNTDLNNHHTLPPLLSHPPQPQPILNTQIYLHTPQSRTPPPRAEWYYLPESRPSSSSGKRKDMRMM